MVSLFGIRVSLAWLFQYLPSLSGFPLWHQGFPCNYNHLFFLLIIQHLTLGFDDEEYDMDMALQQEDLSHETLGHGSQTHREMLDMQPEEDSLPCVPASDHARVVRDLSLDMEREMCNQYDLDSEDVAVEASSSFSSKCVLPEAITQPSTPPQSNNAHETPLQKKKATSSDSDITKRRISIKGGLSSVHRDAMIAIGLRSGPLLESYAKLDQEKKLQTIICEPTFIVV